jgi:hypothetical protein
MKMDSEKAYPAYGLPFSCYKKAVLLLCELPWRSFITQDLKSKVSANDDRVLIQQTIRREPVSNRLTGKKVVETA